MASTDVGTRDWTPGERDVIVDTVRQAPSGHGGTHWVLRLGCGDASVHERPQLLARRDDPLGRDRLLSCGAALANLVLAVRMLGWAERLELFPDGDYPDEVGRVTTVGRREPSTVDTDWFAAVGRRYSHRLPFAADVPPGRSRAELADAARTDGVQLRPIRDTELPALAALLHNAATMVGPHDGRRGETVLPFAWTGSRHTRVPTAAAIADRIGAELLLLVLTPDDGPADQVRAGMALQRTWLAATAAGLACSVLTRPLFAPAVRGGLVERLDLAGHPQALLRIGRPTEGRTS